MWKALLIAAMLLITATADAQQTVLCESGDNRYHECRVDIGRVDLMRQLSKTECVQGESWGWRDGVVWVDRGCRAEFAVTGRGSRRSPRSLDRGRESIVTCESSDGRRKVCSADTSAGVVLDRQLSKVSCVEGSSWGTSRYGIWVDRGCRAEFVVGGNRNRNWRDRVREGGVDRNEQNLSIVCESRDGRRTRCSADTRYGVQLTRRISQTGCEMNRDWGYDRTGIWVDNGCRAEFSIRGSSFMGGSAQRGESVVCESRDGRRAFCPADTRFGVTLRRKTSDAGCVLNRSWGYDRSGIWVDQGCRAEFTLDSRR